MNIHEELLCVLKRCCVEKDVTGILRIENEKYTITLESKEANNQVERLLYDAILHYGVSSDSKSVQFMYRGDSGIAFSFEAFGLEVDKQAELKIRLLRPSYDFLETVLDYAKRLGLWKINVDKDKVLKGESTSTMVCFSVDEAQNLTVSTAEKGMIRNFVLERTKEGVDFSIPYNWDEFEKLVTETDTFPFCDAVSLDIANLSFKKGLLPTTKKPLVLKQDKELGGLVDVCVIGGRT